MITERKAELTSEKRNDVDAQYLNLLRDILENGHKSEDRTGTGTLRVLGRELKFDLQAGFPLLTTKRVWFRGVKEELLFFIRGERNVRSLILRDVHIWDEWPFQKYLEKQGLDKMYPRYTPPWQLELEAFVREIRDNEDFAREWGDLGPIYGYKWRHWQKREGGEIDQLANAINVIKTNPNSRRIIINTWDPEDIDKMVLPPCHGLIIQFQVDGGRLNCDMFQRSADTFLGVPFNIASYAIFTEIVAKITGKEPGELTVHLGDTHLYLNHIEKAKLQLTREPKVLPRLILGKIKDIDNIPSEEIRIEGYQPHPAIHADISV